MSFTTLSDLETCPRRWALSTAEYPEIWQGHGYPRPLYRPALEGTVVHLSLQNILRALAERGCSSLSDRSAISTVKELGGFTEIVRSALEQALQPFKENPRATSVVDGIQRRVVARIPELRTRVQNLLTRIHLTKRRANKLGKTASRGGTRTRSQLSYGLYSEIELRAEGIGWHGVPDLLTLSTTKCEIRDFKTGEPKQEHEFQVRTYALLWGQDNELNPTGQLVNKLVLSYDGGDKEIAAPSKEETCQIAAELQQRTTEALAPLRSDPPVARPSLRNCKRCPVRHLCEEYWYWRVEETDRGEPARTGFGDVQIKLSSKHGPQSWNGEIESGPDLKVGKPILLRTTNLQFDLTPRQRIRLLNVHISIPKEDLFDEPQHVIVATMSANSEIFILA